MQDTKFFTTNIFKGIIFHFFILSFLHYCSSLFFFRKFISPKDQQIERSVCSYQNIDKPYTVIGAMYFHTLWTWPETKSSLSSRYKFSVLFSNITLDWPSRGSKNIGIALASHQAHSCDDESSTYGVFWYNPDACNFVPKACKHVNFRARYFDLNWSRWFDNGGMWACGRGLISGERFKTGNPWIHTVLWPHEVRPYSCRNLNRRAWWIYLTILVYCLFEGYKKYMTLKKLEK